MCDILLFPASRRHFVRVFLVCASFVMGSLTGCGGQSTSPPDSSDANRLTVATKGRLPTSDEVPPLEAVSPAADLTPLPWEVEALDTLPRAAPAKLGALDLLNGGIPLTMQAPLGATVAPRLKDALVRYGKRFALRVGVLEEEAGHMSLARRGLERSPPEDVLANQPNKLIYSMGRRFHCSLVVEIEGVKYLCHDEWDIDDALLTKEEVLLMAACAESLTQTAANKQGAARMQAALARFRELGCDYRPSFNMLILESSYLKDADLALMKDIPQADHVTLAAPEVTVAGLKHLAELPNLRSVTFKGRHVSDSWMAALRPLKLHSLWLYDTNVTPKGWLELESQTALIRFFLWGQPVDETGLANLARITSLTELVLDKVELKDAGLSRLLPLVNLVTLKFASNQITDEGMSQLAGFKKLRQLEISDNKVTAAGVEKFLKLNPDCRVMD